MNVRRHVYIATELESERTPRFDACSWPSSSASNDFMPRIVLHRAASIAPPASHHQHRIHQLCDAPWMMRVSTLHYSVLPTNIYTCAYTVSGVSQERCGTQQMLFASLFQPVMLRNGIFWRTVSENSVL